MRKYIKYNLIGLALLALIIAGCDTASQEVADVVSPDGYPTVTFETDASGTTYAEGDTIKYTMTLEKQLDRSVTFSAHVIGGDATDDDFTVVPATVAAYSNTAEMLIIIDQDDVADPDETVQLEIGAFSLAEKYLVDPDTENPVLEFTITNWESADLQATLGWDRIVEINPNYADYPDHINEEHAGSWIDFDIFLEHVEGDSILWDFGDASTGSEPEEFIMPKTHWDQPVSGTYNLWAFNYYNGFDDPDEVAGMTVDSVLVPVTAHFLQSGVFETEFVQTDDDAFNTYSDDWAVSGAFALSYICSVVVDGDNYTIVDGDGTQVKKEMLLEELKARIPRK